MGNIGSTEDCVFFFFLFKSEGINIKLGLRPIKRYRSSWAAKGLGPRALIECGVLLFLASVRSPISLEDSVSALFLGLDQFTI